MEMSFLIGSGFSVVDGYPGRKKINERMRKISHSEIIINPEGTAFFLDGKSDPNIEWMMIPERHFIERLLDYYTMNIIPSLECFDYEYFFDFYQGFINGKYQCYKFEDFTSKFRDEMQILTDDRDLLIQFNNTFNQLVADLLYRQNEMKYLKKPYIKYARFLDFIDDIKDSNEKIHIHTLNHDLLLEELSSSEAFDGLIKDGFEEEGSLYFSKNSEGLDVKLQRFTNNFNGKFGLYKLHGSLDNYIFRYKDDDDDEVKIPFGISLDALVKEYINESGDIVREKCFWNYYPDFLSGTTSKVDRYGESNYYRSIFDHFISNLKKSNTLISIGYGLKDFKINEIIRDNFLADPTKKMIIISPDESEGDLLKFESVIYYGKGLGVQDITKSRIDEILNQ